MAVVAGLAMMIPGYVIAAPYQRTLVTGIVTSLWLLPASFYLGSNIRYHQRTRGSAPDPAVALLEAIRRDHPEV